MEMVQGLRHFPRNLAYFDEVDAADAAVDDLLAQALLGELHDEEVVVSHEAARESIALLLARREQAS